MSDGASVASEWYDGFEGEYVVEECLSFADVHSVNVVSDFTAVFEVDPEVGAAGFGG